MIAEVLNSYALTLDYLRRLIDDVPDEALAGQRRAVVNHPLWTIGHLVYAAQMTGSELSLPAWLPNDWQQRYSTGSVPLGARSAYASKEVLLDALNDAHRRLSERLKSMSAEDLRQRMPDVRYREMFPTLGHAVAHVLVAHTASHIGQVIVWRRVMGFAPLSKVFD